MSTQPPRPAVIELVQTRGPRKRVVGDHATYWHARIRAAGNRRVTWWSEDYNRKGGAVHAIELLPGFRMFYPPGTTTTVIFRGTAETLLVRTVDARRG